MNVTWGSVFSSDCIEVLRMDGSFLFTAHKTYPSLTFGPWLKGDKSQNQVQIFISDFRKKIYSRQAQVSNLAKHITSQRNKASVSVVFLKEPFNDEGTANWKGTAKNADVVVHSTARARVCKPER
jgi:hypothetical protein